MLVILKDGSLGIVYTVNAEKSTPAEEGTVTSGLTTDILLCIA